MPFTGNLVSNSGLIPIRGASSPFSSSGIINLPTSQNQFPNMRRDNSGNLVFSGSPSGFSGTVLQPGVLSGVSRAQTAVIPQAQNRFSSPTSPNTQPPPISSNVAPPAAQAAPSPAPGTSTLNPPQGAAYQLNGFYYDANNKSLGPVPSSKFPAGAQPVNSPFTPANTSLGNVSALVANMASQPSAAFTSAQNQYLQANQELAALREQEAQQNQNILGGRTNLAEAGGEQGLLQNLAAGREAALTGQMSAAQAAAQSATQQEATQLAALNQAAGLVSPVPAPALGLVSPSTGQLFPYGGGTPGQGIATAGQTLGNLQNATQFQTNMLPNYNAAVNVANHFMNWLDTPGDQGGGKSINSWAGDLNLGHQLQAWVTSGNFSNPQYPELNTFLNDFGNKISAVVGAAGGDITNYKRQLVATMMDPSASPESIKQQINTIMGVANDTMQGVTGTFGGSWSPPETGAGSGISNNSSNAANSAIGYDGF